MKKERISQLFSDLEQLDSIRKTLIQAQDADDSPPAVILIGYMWSGESVSSMQRLLNRYRTLVSDSDYHVAYTVFQLKSREFQTDCGAPDEHAILSAIRWAEENPISRNPMLEDADTEGLTVFIKDAADKLRKRTAPHPH